MYFMTCSISLILKDSFSLICFSEDQFLVLETCFSNNLLFFVNSHFLFYISEIGPELLTRFPCTSNSWVSICFFSFVIFSFASLALLSLLLMFLVLNFCNLSSFLLSLMFIYSFSFLLICKFLLSSLIAVSFCNPRVF